MNLVVDSDELMMLKRALYYAILLEETNLDHAVYDKNMIANTKEDIAKFKKLKEKLNGK